MQPLMELGHGRQGQTKQGGVKQVSTLVGRGIRDNTCPTFWCGILLSTRRRTLTTCRGVASYPPLKTLKMEINQETRTDSKSMRPCSSKKKGGKTYSEMNPLSVNPLSVMWVTGLKPPKCKLPKCHMGYWVEYPQTPHKTSNYNR